MRQLLLESCFAPKSNLRAKFESRNLMSLHVSIDELLRHREKVYSRGHVVRREDVVTIGVGLDLDWIDDRPHRSYWIHLNSQ
jgi:hypothetical protein